MYDATAILPTRTNVNPSTVEKGDPALFTNDGFLYVLADVCNLARPRRVIASHGDTADRTMTLGSHDRYHHDQAGYFMGVLQVVGIRNMATGETWGDVPNRKLPVAVFK